MDNDSLFGLSGAADISVSPAVENGHQHLTNPFSPIGQNMTTTSENDLPVYEDILFIGQEHCVEDWPNDSPELSPEWKPAGKLKLRRASLQITEFFDGSKEANATMKKNGKLTQRKKRLSFLARGSKDKFEDETEFSDMSPLEQCSKKNEHNFTPSVPHQPTKLFFKKHSLDENTLEFNDKQQFADLSDESKGANGITKQNGNLTQRKKRLSFLARGSKDKFEDELEFSKMSPLEQCSKKKEHNFKPSVLHQPSKLFSKKHSLDENVDLGSLFNTLEVNDKQQIPETNRDPYDEGNAEEIDGNAYAQKQKKKVKVHFVPHRGFVIGFNKESRNDELKGACGYTQQPDIKEDLHEKEFQKGADLFTALDANEKHQEMQDYRPGALQEKEFQKGADLFTALDAHEKHQKMIDYQTGDLQEKGLQKGADLFTALDAHEKHQKMLDYQTEDLQEKEFQKGADLFTALDAHEKHQEMQDCRPKKAMKFKGLRLHRRRSKGTKEAESNLMAINDHDASEMKKPVPVYKVPPLPQRKNKDIKGLPEIYLDPPGATSGNYYLSDTAKKKDKKDLPEKHVDPVGAISENYFLSDAAMKKNIKDFPENDLDPPGATSENYFLSDAAKAEWMSAQMDIKRTKKQEEEEKLNGMEQEGDTDSLMEWWDAVERWDELPLDEKITLKEDETISFKATADKVHRGLRVYLKLFMERAELLYQHVLILYVIADDLSNFHHRAKIANITGGTTTAVGGAAAIAGLALVPVTFGASIIISAIGLGVATAGGITAASATISDNVNNMHDRKKIEIIIHEYEAQLVEMHYCLQFITEGLRRLRGHPLLRRNNYYTGDWEVRRALQTISLVTEPVERAEEITNNTLTKLISLHEGMDRYFTKDSKEVKKGCKKEVTAEVRNLAKQLHDGLVELNSIREQLLDASLF